MHWKNLLVKKFIANPKIYGKSKKFVKIAKIVKFEFKLERLLKFGNSMNNKESENSR